MFSASTFVLACRRQLSTRYSPSRILHTTIKDRSKPRSIACSARVSPSIATRAYAIKPLLIENAFPKFDSSVPQPTEIKLKKSERNLYVKWADGCEVKLPAEYLRVESPSAEVQGHGGSHEKRLIYGRKYVNIIGIEPQGHYGVLLKFDDLHESGIYSWDYLRYLGQNKFSIMKRYILNLRQAGKSRDPRQNTAKKVAGSEIRKP